MAIHVLTPSFLATKLVCPGDKRKIEMCDKVVPGLLIEVRSVEGALPTWYWRFKTDGKTRLRRLGSLSELALEDARKQVQLLKAQHAMGQSLHKNELTGEGVTLGRFFQDHYLPHAKVHKRSWPRDEQLYRLQIAEKFGHVPLARLTRREFQLWHNALPAKGLSLASANHALQLCRHLLSMACSWELLDRNVLKGVPLFTLDNQVEHYLDEEQVERLVGVLKTDDNRLVCLIVLFLLSTGARLREGLCARWDQIDMEKATWRIPASNTKSKRLKHLPLNASAIWALQQAATLHQKEYVFPSPVTGKPFSTITRVWWRLRRKAGLPANIRVHDLRHSYASRLASSGRSLYEIQTLLGHADPRTSMRYSHLSMTTKREAAESAALRL